jgi:hypothetical protein
LILDPGSGLGGDATHFSLRDSGINHGVNSAGAVTAMGAAHQSEYFAIGAVSTDGGCRIKIVAEQRGDGMVADWEIIGHASCSSTGGGSTSNGMQRVVFKKHDGSNGLGAFDANENCFVVQKLDSSGTRNLMILQADGDVYFDTTPQTFDEYDDAQLARAFDLTTAPDNIIDSKFDEFIQYKQDDLIKAGILGGPVYYENGERIPVNEEHGMWNVHKHVKLLNGAVWQNYTALQEAKEEIAELKQQLIALTEGKDN